LHPLYGQDVAVLRVDRNPAVPQLLVETPQGSQFLPCWMTDLQHCQRLTWGFVPCCSVAALQQVETLVASLDESVTPPSEHS